MIPANVEHAGQYGNSIAAPTDSHCCLRFVISEKHSFAWALVSPTTTVIRLSHVIPIYSPANTINKPMTSIWKSPIITHPSISIRLYHERHDIGDMRRCSIPMQPNLTTSFHHYLACALLFCHTPHTATSTNIHYYLLRRILLLLHYHCTQRRLGSRNPMVTLQLLDFENGLHSSI